jgi:hypothetical protein
VQPGKDGGPPRAELFDYQTDPDETRNHAAAHPEVVRELLERLERVPALGPTSQPAKSETQ